MPSDSELRGGYGGVRRAFVSDVADAITGIGIKPITNNLSTRANTRAGANANT